MSHAAAREKIAAARLRVPATCCKTETSVV